MELKKSFVKPDTKRIRLFLILLIFALAAELIVFQFRSIVTLGNKEIVLAEDVNTTSGEYESRHILVNRKVENIRLEGLSVEGADLVSFEPWFSDDGNAYVYPLPQLRAVPSVPSSCYTDIHPYGKVQEIFVRLYFEGGASVHVDRILLNTAKPFDIKPLHILILFILATFLYFCWSSIAVAECRRKCIPQLCCTFLCVVCLMALGRKLASSNEVLANDPPEHHLQYQQLTEALEEGHVNLTDKAVSEELKAKENPYDTMALLAEGVDFRMDYAYYNGEYYVYFGIVPELTFFLPWYKIHGEMPDNSQAMWRFYALLVIGVFLLMWELIQRYKKGEFPFFLYLAMSIGFSLWANFVYLVSRPDVYDIPLLAGSAFLLLGLGLLFAAMNRSGRKRIPFLACGGLSVACVAGCRPQLMLFAAPLIFIFLFGRTEEGKLSFRARELFTKKSIPETLALIIPVIPVAIAVCWYNLARFGNIFEFGATFSLTSNDMNLRGFNIDRLLRGMYCFFFQPPVTTTDFPYLISSVLEGDYMGRNLVEFTFGGFFAACPLLLVHFAPIFGLWKKLDKELRIVWLSLLAAALVIAGFDVNGAGVLYRYSCDPAPGLVAGAMLLWIPLLSGEKAKLSKKIFSLLLVQSLFYSLQVYLSPGGDVYSIYETSPVLFERIRAYFRG